MQKNLRVSIRQSLKTQEFASNTFNDTLFVYVWGHLDAHSSVAETSQ